MGLCEYGCGQEAKYQLKNGRRCCSQSSNGCKKIKEKVKKTCLKKYGVTNPSKVKKVKEKRKQTFLIRYGVTNPSQVKEVQKKIKQTCLKKYGVDHPTKSEEYKKQWLKKHPFLCKIEEIKVENNNYYVHCKNHNCPNSKEKGGWFIPTPIQLNERVVQLEHLDGNGGSYFYCSEKCKNECPLYYMQSDPNQNKEKLYTLKEYQTFRDFVLERDNYECQICGSKENLHVHHIQPQKLEPFLALDPDNGICLCEKCHYKYGHKDECNTGHLSRQICKENKKI